MLGVHRSPYITRHLRRPLVNCRISCTAFHAVGRERREPSHQVVFGENEEDVYRRHSSFLRKKGGKSEIIQDKTDDENEFVDDYEPDDLAMDGYVEPTEMLISYVSEDIRRELFSLHREDPNRWTPVELSRRYNMTVRRVKSIVYLACKREEAIEKLIPSAQSKGEKWMEIYQKYVDDPEENDVNKLSAETKLPADQVQDIIIRMKQNECREANMTAAVDSFNDQMKFFEFHIS